MATRWAVATGNWSDPATWDGGTLPGADDDVYADGKTVTIDQSATVTTIRTTQRSGGTVGGGFVLNAGVTFTATNPLAAGGGVIAGNSAALTYLDNSGSATILSDLVGSNVPVLTVSGTGSLTIVGNCGATYHTHVVYVLAAATISITGSVKGATIHSYFGTGLYIDAAANVTVVGSVQSGVGHGDAYGISIASVATVAVVGSVTAGYTNAINCSVAANITVTGTLTASTVAAALSSSHISAVNKLSGPFINTAGTMAVYAKKMYLTDTTANRWEFTTDVGTQRNLYSADSIGGNPAVADVRLHTTYGPANELTGVCAVPPAASVSYGVPVDQTTGTALLDASAIASALNASTLASDYTALAVAFGQVGDAQNYEQLAADYTALAADVGTLQSDVSEISARILEQIPDETPALVIPAPTEATMTTAYIYCYDEHGAPEEGVTLQMRLKSVSGSGAAYDHALVTATSNSEGLAAAEIPRGAGLQFLARRGASGAWIPVAGVDADTLELPALLGTP